MYLKSFIVTSVSSALLLVLAGCAGVGTGGQFQNTVYDTHRRVANLDTTLGSSVNRLSQTSAELLARVETSDQEMKRLQGLTEENQVKLMQIEKKLDSLRDAVYRSMGMSRPPGTGISEVTVDPSSVTIEQPGNPSPSGAASAVAPTSQAAPLEDLAQATPAPATTMLPPSAGSADADFQQAQRSFAKQDAAGYTTALAEFEAFVQRYPDSPHIGDAQFWKARSLQGLDRHDEAIAAFERFRAANSSHAKVPYSLHNQAISHARLGQNDRAMALFEQVIREYPMSPAADQAKTDLKKLKS